MLLVSDNNAAEDLTKEIGLKVAGQGTTAAGTAASIAHLQALGLWSDALKVNDGSGLDDGDRLSCDALVGLLDKAGPDSTLAKGLPVAGRTGTLHKRMRHTVAEGNVFAKTGTLDNPPVASLSGFERTQSGATLTFAYVQNGGTLKTMYEDQLALLLSTYPQAPSLDDLAPKGP
jgi:D-alanyl-D-alanine carboxypeptidase/D-alanyl-D-alanine-endopeptidase (penicillin-binding protein 4)